MIKSQNSGIKSDQFQLVPIYPTTVETGCTISVAVNHVVVYTIIILLDVLGDLPLLFFFIDIQM